MYYYKAYIPSPGLAKATEETLVSFFKNLVTVVKESNKYWICRMKIKIQWVLFLKLVYGDLLRWVGLPSFIFNWVIMGDETFDCLHCLQVVLFEENNAANAI